MEPIQESFPDLLARLERTHGPEGDAPEPETDEITPRAPAKVVSLPQWAEAKRGVPHAALRSALFAAIQGPKRRALERELLATPGGLEIRFTGWQLNQSDLDVWEQLLHVARLHPLGARCEFTAHHFLRELGRSWSHQNHDWLKRALSRLSASDVEITQGQHTYHGSLIIEGVRDQVSGRYIVEVNPKLATLFQAGWTALDEEQRRLLRRKPLAQWLHGYLASHAAPFPVTVEYLHRMSGSNTKQIWKFKQNLVAALKTLEGIGVILSFEVVDNLVSVETIPSPSQRKHLNQAKSRKKIPDIRGR